MALNGLFCADVPLRNYSLTHCFAHCYRIKHEAEMTELNFKENNVY